jgi:hypothetical protein
MNAKAVVSAIHMVGRSGETSRRIFIPADLTNNCIAASVRCLRGKEYQLTRLTTRLVLL